MNGLERTALVKQQFPKVKVIILTMLDHEKYIVQAFKNSASAYILKNITSPELVFCIKFVYKNDHRYICSELS